MTPPSAPDVEQPLWSAADLMKASENLRTLIAMGAPYGLTVIKEAADALADASAAAQPRAAEVQRLHEAVVYAKGEYHTCHADNMKKRWDEYATAEAAFRQALAALPVDGGWNAAIEAAAKWGFDCEHLKQLGLDTFVRDNIRALARPAGETTNGC